MSAILSRSQCINALVTSLWWYCRFRGGHWWRHRTDSGGWGPAINCQTPNRWRHKTRCEDPRLTASTGELKFYMSQKSRRRHQMETFSASLALCEGNPPVTGGFPSQRPVVWSFDVFFDFFAWTNRWAHNQDAGDLRRHRAHYDSTVMMHTVWCVIHIPQGCCSGAGAM